MFRVTLQTFAGVPREFKKQLKLLVLCKFFKISKIASVKCAAKNYMTFGGARAEKMLQITALKPIYEKSLKKYLKTVWKNSLHLENT